VKTLASIVILLPLAACSTGNDRPWVGNPDLPVGGDGGSVYIAALKDAGRPEAPPTPDAPSLTGLSRANWSPSILLVPVDTTAATRTYAVNRMWTDATARQRGQMATPISALELSGDSHKDQVEEAVMSFPLALLGGFLIIPRMVTHYPWTEVRYFPQDYWRAPASTLRKPMVVYTAPPAPPPEVAPAPTPATVRPEAPPVPADAKPAPSTPAAQPPEPQPAPPAEPAVPPVIPPQ
jgi:hypothetical protein